MVNGSSPWLWLRTRGSRPSSATHSSSHDLFIGSWATAACSVEFCVVSLPPVVGSSSRGCPGIPSFAAQRSLPRSDTPAHQRSARRDPSRRLPVCRVTLTSPRAPCPAHARNRSHTSALENALTSVIHQVDRSPTAADAMFSAISESTAPDASVIGGMRQSSYHPETSGWGVGASSTHTC